MRNLKTNLFVNLINPTWTPAMQVDIWTGTAFHPVAKRLSYSLALSSASFEEEHLI